MATPRIITAPAYWASALVNDDYTALSVEEHVALAAWREQENYPNIVSIADDPETGEPKEARFTWSYELYAGPLCTCHGGDVLDYVVLDD